MKEELRGKLVEILTSIQTAAGKASDFAMAELPGIAQDYILYGRFVTTLGVVACVALAVLSYYAVRVSVRELGKEYLRQREFVVMGGGAGGAALGFVALIVTPIAVSQCILVWFVPKVWLLKEIAALLK